MASRKNVRKSVQLIPDDAAVIVIFNNGVFMSHKTKINGETLRTEHDFGKLSLENVERAARTAAFLMTDKVAE